MYVKVFALHGTEEKQSNEAVYLLEIIRSGLIATASEGVSVVFNTQFSRYFI